MSFTGIRVAVFLRNPKLVRPRISSRDRQYLRCFFSLFDATSYSVFQQKVGNYNAKKQNEIFKKSYFKKDQQSIGKQEANLTENLNEFDTAVASLSKQKDKNLKKGKKRPLQNEREEEMRL